MSANIPSSSLTTIKYAYSYQALKQQSIVIGKDFLQKIKNIGGRRMQTNHQQTIHLLDHRHRCLLGHLHPRPHRHWSGCRPLLQKKNEKISKQITQNASLHSSRTLLPTVLKQLS